MVLACHGVGSSRLRSLYLACSQVGSFCALCARREHPQQSDVCGQRHQESAAWRAQVACTRCQRTGELALATEAVAAGAQARDGLVSSTCGRTPLHSPPCAGQLGTRTRPLTGRLPPGAQGRVRRVPPGVAAVVRPAHCARALCSGWAADAGARPPHPFTQPDDAHLPAAASQARIVDRACCHHGCAEPAPAGAGGGLRAGGPPAEPLRRAVRLLLCSGCPEVRSPRVCYRRYLGGLAMGRCPGSRGRCAGGAACRGVQVARASERDCSRCHSRMGVLFQAVAFALRAPRAPRAPPPGGAAARGEAGPPPGGFAAAVQPGQPLPEMGACRHYRHSHRWLRFPCCGQRFPCDLWCAPARTRQGAVRARRPEMLSRRCSQHWHGRLQRRQQGAAGVDELQDALAVQRGTACSRALAVCAVTRRTPTGTR
jgi:hypothetical protein